MTDYKILVVNDYQPNTLLIKTILEKEGYSILTTENKKDSCETARQHKPQLILLELEMTDTDGYEILKDLKSHPATTHIPVIITSGHIEADLILKGYQLGALEYISQPIKPEELRRRVEHYCDVYQLAQMKRELELTIESHNVLYSMLTHALYSPLSSLKIVNSSLLRIVDRKQIGEDGFEMLQSMNQTTVEMSLSLNNMQQIIKISQHKQRAHKQQADINSLIDEAVEMFRPVASFKDITIQTQDLDTELTGEIDMEMIQTVIQNLLSNAIKYNHTGGTVQVSSSLTKNGDILVCISDSGKGIKGVEKERLLDTPDGNASEMLNEYGSGLGLIVCKAFIELHNGKFWFESEEGKGSSFYFSLKADLEDPI